MTKQATIAMTGGYPAVWPHSPIQSFWCGQVDYTGSWQAMRRFSSQRGSDCPDQIWLLEHDPVYTAGLSCHDVPASIHGISAVRSDRGGRMSYHGPGQLMFYPLIDLHRRGLTIRGYVRLLEQTVIDTLSDYGISACRWPTRPGVFIGSAKIAFIGVRVIRGCTYHGLSVNVDMDMEPFRYIDPCGFPDLSITSLEQSGLSRDARRVGIDLSARLNTLLADPGAVTVPSGVTTKMESSVCV